jgi:predicted ArsR family transcriptional regulator
MAMTTARQRVFNYLKKQRSASAAQIGHGLNMSAANIRHHLSVMLGDGRIALIGQKRRGGRGRPVKIYGLSEKYLGDNFVLLLDAALDELLKKLSPVRQEAALQAMARSLVRSLGELDSNIPATKRLALIVDRLNALYYQSRWEAGAQGPHILFAHCPYAAVIEKHPELCRMDEILLAELTGTTARQLAKIGRQPAGSPYCIFQV